MTNNVSKRGWLPQEDALLLELVTSVSPEKLKWVEVSRLLQEKCNRTRSGKQCRERWQHQLNPLILRDEWTADEQNMLFALQNQLGNKWVQIAEHIPGRTDNAVKNYFYSAIRRVFTRVNLYLSKHRSRKEFRSIRQFQSEFLSKLMTVVDGKYDKRVRLSNKEIAALAKDILSKVVSLIGQKHDLQDETVNFRLESLIEMMHLFRKSCRKRRQKRNDFDKSDFIENEAESSSRRDSIESPIPSPNQDAKVSNKTMGFHDDFGKFYQSQMQDENEQNYKQDTKYTEGIIQRDLTDKFTISISTQSQHKGIFEEWKMPEPVMFKVFSNHAEEKLGGLWEMLQNMPVNSDIITESWGEWEWKNENDVPFRDDILGSSQLYSSDQTVTKVKMLEVSMALEDLLLNARNSSRCEAQYHPSKSISRI